MLCLGLHGSPGQGLGAGEAAAGRPRPKAALPPLHLLLAPFWWAVQGRAAPSFRTQHLTAVLKVFPWPENRLSGQSHQ